ncbi:MAG: CueP family metal-binding protein [Thermodesulfobacteriota bacterium]
MHYFSSCQGELANQKFEVKAVDREGQVLFDGTAETLRNGFFELWLPRNRKVDLSIQWNKLAARGRIETSDEGLTCITTFRLQ